MLSWLAAHGCTPDPTSNQDAPSGTQSSEGSVRHGSAHASAQHAADDGLRPVWNADPHDDLAGQPQLSAPRMLGMLIGTRKRAEPEGVEFFGTDMGLTVEHEGELYMLFGDTWATRQSVCEPMLLNDDVIGVLPRTYAGGVPSVRLLTQADAPRKLAHTRVYRGSESLAMGFGRAPIAGFSDGRRSYAIVQRLEPARCGVDACATDDEFSCEQDVGVCEPSMFPLTMLCDAREASGAPANGCLLNQKCSKASLCVDLTASQYTDGSFQGRQGAVAFTTEIAAARSGEPTVYDSLLSWPTNKFAMPNTRTVARFTGKRDGNDYGPGHDTLLYWGRSGHLAENGRESQLYLMAHRLPLEVDGSGKLRFEPQFFAGVDALGEPIWSPLQSRAQPIALDGREGGSPHELLQIIGMYTISWLPAPINKWMMMYGGDLADYLMLNPLASRSTWQPGAVYVRFADHPWGPFSPPIPHLSPGSPQRPNDGNGPGGFLFHPNCRDTSELRCARSDLHRPPDSAVDCQIQVPDPGRLYQPNIIDNYTQPNADGGLDIIWNVSTWNPYGVQLVKTSVYPADRGELEPSHEPADRSALARLANWNTLPELGLPRRYLQQSSRARDARVDRDYNNFVCLGRDAQARPGSLGNFHFDAPACDESYVRGAVLARFEGSGYLVRTWLSALSLTSGPADDEQLRVYVDDDPRPVVDVPLAEALDGRAGEIFAPPFGAGSPLHLSWHYPIAFRRKLIVALDGLDRDDVYRHQSDAVLDLTPLLELPASARLPQRDAAARQLSERYRPAGLHPLLFDPTLFTLAGDTSEEVRLAGPATIHELRVRFAEADLPRMAAVRIRVRWDGAAEPAIDVPLLDLLGGSVPPDQTSLALTSYVEGADRVLALKLPMPFSHSAQLELSNTGRAAAKFELRLHGERDFHLAPFGKLHVQPSETVWPTRLSAHTAASGWGRGKLVGVCGQLGVDAASLSDGLQLLDRGVHANVDGARALDGAGAAAYAGDGFYYANLSHATPFAQTWGPTDGLQPPVRASFCRWHVLGTELQFEQSLDLTFELGSQMNAAVIDRFRTLAYLYLED
ncbi:MAG TPA: DUF2961 domain-containing protein [Polyangiales bacterium]|nr:DUF2961 domain-containing protein [Polyangiales bacterium]